MLALWPNALFHGIGEVAERPAPNAGIGVGGYVGWIKIAKITFQCRATGKHQFFITFGACRAVAGRTSARPEQILAAGKIGILQIVEGALGKQGWCRQPPQEGSGECGKDQSGDK